MTAIPGNFTSPWHWWLCALADPAKIGTDALPIQPQFLRNGFYRIFGTEWEPVRIYDNGTKAERNFVAVPSGDIVSLWVACCHEPIAEDRYDRARLGRDWIPA